MQRKVILVAFILLMQECVLLLAQTPAPTESESGILQRVADRYSAIKSKAQSIREKVQIYAGMYYEDHIKPIADPYMEWASGISSAGSDLWERFKPY